MPTMILFVGLQGSGKTTFFERHLAAAHVHVSLDVLNTRNRERLAIEECLAAGRDFVIDNTNPSRQDRARYFEMIRGHDYEAVGYYFRSALAECLERNDLREGKKRLPAKALKGTAARLELPSLDEGFARLHYVSIRDGRFVVEPWREEEEKAQ